MKHLLLNIAVILSLSLFYSCNKTRSEDIELFYGQWKASYGDTITFSRDAGKNMLRYDVSGSPAVPGSGYYEFSFRHNKLGIKDEISPSFGFRFFQSFRWIEKGSSFEVQGVEWFPYMSSTLPFFTFTRIP